MSEAVYLITGAGRGIGAALAKRLASPGRVIGINYRADDAAAAATAKAVEAKGARALLLKADVSDAAAVDALFEQLPAAPLEALVCNAGLPPRYARLAETEPAELEAQWRSQAFAAALCCRKALPGMMKRKAGRIVFVLSTAAQGTPQGFMAAYVSAKYALRGLARALEVELAGRGVSVSCAFPRMTKTDFIKSFPRPIVDAAEEAQGGLDSPEAAAEKIAALVEGARQAA